MTAIGATWRADMWLYDRLQAGARPAVDDRIVQVVVDDRSLAALGRWPWPRSTHTRLLERLQAAPPRGVALDVLFAEPDADPDIDRALAAAIARNGRVVLPVMVDGGLGGALPTELMPLPALIDASAALAHVEIDLDRDGVARRAALHAGLGSAHWPALALALRDLDPAARAAVPPWARRAETAKTGPLSPYQWVRDDRILMPFAPPAAFHAVSYVDVLDGSVPASLLRGRWLIVGADASGLGTRVTTPAADDGIGQSALGYHANLLNTLLQDGAILPMPAWQQMLAGAALVLLPVALARPRRRAGTVWSLMGISAALTLLACVLLWLARIWFPPGATLLTLLAGAAILMASRLRKSQRQASSDGLTGLANRFLFDATLAREMASARRSQRPLSLLLIDVDHFKHYNDSRGHQAGDEVLRRIAASLLQWARRPRDLAARYGGDELVLILPETSAHAAASIAASLLDAVRGMAIAHPRSATAPHVTLSIGAATFDPVLERREIDLLKRADAALYQAKSAGRDRSHDASLPQVPPPAPPAPD
nr:diguanylate cyclase [Luteimonas sp. BDR2-5]